MKRETKGSWIVHHSGKLQSVSVLTPAYSQIKMAGAAGRLLSGLSGSAQRELSAEQVEALAVTCGIDRRMELPTVLGELEKAALLDIGKSGGVSVLGATTSQVLGHTANIFDAIQPSDHEKGAILLAEHASHAPVLRHEFAEELADSLKLPKGVVAEICDDAERIGFTDHEGESDDRLYFNGNLFRGPEAADKVRRVRSALSEDDLRRLAQFTDELGRAGVLHAERGYKLFGAESFERFLSVGMFDVNEVANAQESAHFVTLPASFNKYGNAAIEDAFHLAKAFVAALAYGMSRSHPGRGRISMIEALLKKLIQGGEVGPATAIGQDYKVLEQKGVIRVRQDRGMYFMTLLKRDVGELALTVLTSGDASGESLPSLPGAAVTRYSEPEVQRIQVRRKTVAPHKKDIQDALRALRSHKGRP